MMDTCCCHIKPILALLQYEEGDGPQAHARSVTAADQSLPGSTLAGTKIDIKEEHKSKGEMLEKEPATGLVPYLIEDAFIQRSFFNVKLS